MLNERITKAESVLITAGLDEIKAKNVLEAIGEALFETELYSNASQTLAYPSKEAVFRELELEYTKEDVLRFAYENDVDLSDEDAYELALEFLSNYDCDLSKNAQIEAIVDDFVAKREMEMDV